MVSKVPDARIYQAYQAPINVLGRLVLCWMIAKRGPSWTFSIDGAIEWTEGLQKPLLIMTLSKDRVSKSAGGRIDETGAEPFLRRFTLYAGF